MCCKRLLGDVNGVYGCQSDAARLGNPAVLTNLYIIQSAATGKAAILPNQARMDHARICMTHARSRHVRVKLFPYFYVRVKFAPASCLRQAHVFLPRNCMDASA